MELVRRASAGITALTGFDGYPRVGGISVGEPCAEDGARRGGDVGILRASETRFNLMGVARPQICSLRAMGYDLFRQRPPDPERAQRRRSSPRGQRLMDFATPRTAGYAPVETGELLHLPALQPRCTPGPHGGG